MKPLNSLADDIPSSEPEIPLYIAGISNQLEGLSKYLTELESRLVIVSVPQESEPVASEKISPARCSIGQSLQDIEVKQAIILGRIQRLIKNLEV